MPALSHEEKCMAYIRYRGTDILTDAAREDLSSALPRVQPKAVIYRSAAHSNAEIAEITNSSGFKELASPLQIQQ